MILLLLPKFYGVLISFWRREELDQLPSQIWNIFLSRSPFADIRLEKMQLITTTM
jgi:hypothetical protein